MSRLLYMCTRIGIGIAKLGKRKCSRMDAGERVFKKVENMGSVSHIFRSLNR